MEIVDEGSLGSEAREAMKRAQKAGQFVEITDEQGQVIALLIPARGPADPDAHDRAWVELERLIEAISPHLPLHVDAVEAIRDARG